MSAALLVLCMFLPLTANAQGSNTTSVTSSGPLVPPISGYMLGIEPPAFLSGVTQHVQLTCRPPKGPSVANVLSLQLFRGRARGGDVFEPLASFLTATKRPTLEAEGKLLNASASVSTAALDPKDVFLGVEIPHPGEIAAGQYMCKVEVLDASGLIVQYQSETANLTSLYHNGSVPLFFQALLVELRKDVDSLTGDLNTVNMSQADMDRLHHDTLNKLSDIETKKQEVTALRDGANQDLAAADSQVTLMDAALNRLRDITPETPVYFYAYFGSETKAVANNVNIVFEVLRDNSYTDAYSTTTGVFTAPAPGTYYLRTGVTGDSTTCAASIRVNDKTVASLVSHDDYNPHQATASVVMQLNTNDTVRVVKTQGSSIFGFTPTAGAAHNRITYFMGMLLW